MKKDKEWLKEEISDVLYLSHLNDSISAVINMSLIRGDIVKLIDKLAEPEKVVVPHFVDEWIKSCENAYLGLGESIGDSYPLSQIGDWMAANEELFAKAWLDGYTIEEEKRYRLKLANKHLKDVYMTFNPRTKMYNVFVLMSESVDGYKQSFTESELEDIDETGFERKPIKEEEK